MLPTSVQQYRTQFNVQRSKYQALGIPWDLTFDQWLGWWQATGKIQQRGRKGTDYVMARKDPDGPFALDNLECITKSENARRLHARGRACYGQNTGTKNGRWQGQIHTPHGTFDTVREAATALDLSPSTLQKRLHSPHFTEWYRADNAT